MKRLSGILLASAACLSAAVPAAHAHHSYALFFDPCRSVTIEGQIIDVQWKEPHVWIELRLDDGSAYNAEWTGLQGLKNRGIAGPGGTALKAGDRIVVTGHPPLDPVKMREAYRETFKTLGPAPNIVSALTQIRRVSDGWSWTGGSDMPPPACAERKSVTR